MRLVSVGLLFLGLATAAAAQDPAIRWGRLSDAEIALSEVEGDPEATAIVLGDLAFDELEPSRDGVRYTRRRHRRVKVLSEAGYEAGEFSLRHSDDARVRNIRAQTFVPQPNGEMRRVEVGRRDIFREEVRDGVEEVRFTMPALAPGAIFEIEYTYESDNYVTLPAWYFQSDHPTVVSEYRVSVPSFLEYVTLRQGVIQDHPASKGSRSFGGTTEVMWSAHGVPALRDEPYTTTYEDYTTRLELQLSRVVQGGIGTDVLTTWNETARALVDNAYFGRRLATSRLRRAQVEGLTGTPEEKARALYDRIRTGYVSTGRGGIFAERDLNDVIESRSGSAPELTLLLAALLGEADVPYDLALLSSRSNGRPVQMYPLVNQFDRVMVVVRHADGSTAYLDPSDLHRPYGVLPVGALNGAAWIVDPDRPEWIVIPPTTGTATTSLVEASLDPTGQLAGTLQLRLEGYDAERSRTRMTASAADAPARAAANAEAVSEAADADDGVDIETVSVEGLDEVDDPLMIEARFVARAGEAIGDEIYLTPFVLMQLDENPFERPVRTFPVDFAYPFARTYVASLTLPEGYAPDEVPAPLTLTIPSRAVSYTRVVGFEPGRLLVRATLRVEQSQVAPIEYPALRQLYEQIVATEAEAIVLVNESGVPPPPPPARPSGDPSDEGNAPDEGGR